MTPPNPNNEIEAELRELKNQLGWLIQRAGEGNENSVKFHREQVLQWVQAHTQEQIRLARLDELLHVYDTDALYFYDDKEDSTTVGRRIKELRDSATEYLDKSVKGDK